VVFGIKGRARVEGFSEHGVEKRYLDQRKRKYKEDGENFILKSFIICTHRLILLVLR
jgi:hypothetical protein